MKTSFTIGPRRPAHRGGAAAARGQRQERRRSPQRRFTSDHAWDRPLAAGFTLVELMMTMLVFTLVSSGIIYGYVQANRMVQWSAISLAAQSFAEQGAEQARAANWNPNGYPMTSNAPGTFDELPPQSEVLSGTNYYLDVPSKGFPGSTDYDFYVTNYVTITDVTTDPAVRQIRSDAVWRFYLTGQAFTNTAILVRTASQ